MSCDYHVYCVPCCSRHDFNDANHQAPLMRHFIRHRDAIAALAPLLSETHGDLTLGTHFGQVDASWFQAHAGHELRVIDEYGRIDGQCERRVPCEHCKTEHWCQRPFGHDGLCSPYPAWKETVTS